jgi:hypothetical protein
MKKAKELVETDSVESQDAEKEITPVSEGLPEISIKDPSSKQSSPPSTSASKKDPLPSSSDLKEDKAPKKKEKGNALSNIIPGYTAPLELRSSSLDSYRPAGDTGGRVGGGLEALRRKALQSDPTLAGAVSGSRENKQRIQAMTGGSSFSYTTNLKKPRKTEQRNDAGEGWFCMKPTPMTEDVKRDLALIKNRNYLDRKRFYKSSDASGSMVQVGTVIEGASEFYSARLAKKDRRTNLVDEVLASSDAEYVQNKFRTMQREKTAQSQKRQRRRTGKR